MNREIAFELAFHCPIALSLHGESGAFQAASPACREVFGQTVDELQSQSLCDLVTEGDRERFRDGWTRALMGQPGVVLRYRLSLAEPGWVESELRRVLPAGDGGESSGLIRLACASRRIAVPSERAKTESAKSELAELSSVPKAASPAATAAAAVMIEDSDRESAMLARKHRDYLVDMLPALVWHGPVAPDGKSYRLSQMNDYLFRISGYTPQEWFRTPGFWSSRIHPDDRQATLDAAQSLMRDGGELAPYRFRIHDGRYLWLQSSIRIERDAHGQPVRMYGLTLDVTRYKQVEEELAHLNRELAQKVEHILELSAPLLPIGEGSLVLPLIGTLDPGRTQHALGQLLDRVVALRARRVIIDLTGVAQADGQSVAALLRATQALRLLGAQPCFCGIRAEIALALRDHHQALAAISTYATLQAALRATLGLR